jgi:hypothetical protein
MPYFEYENSEGISHAPDRDVPTGGQQITNITKANPAVVTIDGSATLNFTVGDNAYFSGVGGMTQVNGNHYPVTNITGGGSVPYTVTLTLDSTAFSTYTGGGTAQKYVTTPGISSTGIATCYNNLFDVGAYNLIAWAAVPNAQRYYVYKLENGVYGYLGQTTALSFTDDNIAPDLSKTPPIQSNPFSTLTDYPGTVSYFEQRRCFAATINDPAYFWATRSGTESNLAYSIPSRDDDSVRFRIAARQRSEIRHIVPLADLILLAETMEWRVKPTGGEVLTPDVALRPQSAIGCGHAPPAIVNNNILFASASGGHLRELGFNQDAGGYITGDLCLRAPHLFDDYSIVDIAYTKAPLPIVWCVSTSGNLLGITYVPEQQVGPWHRHDTEGGVFESICSVPENGVDVLYCVIARQTALGTERFIERLEPRQSTDTVGDFFVDSGLSYSGLPATTFSGLDHLEGKEVIVLADGGVIEGLVVTGGSITLEEAASEVQVGLRIVTDEQTLPVAFEAEGYGQGRPKNVNKVWLRVYSTRDIKVGPSFSKLREYSPRTTEDYDSPPALATGEVEVSLTPQWSQDGPVCIRHDTPLPFTLLSITPEHSVGG